MKRIVIIPALVVAVATATVFTLFWLHNRSCYRNTVYSERFSKKGFARILLGAPRAAVITSLGVPLDTHTNQSYPVWAFGEEQTRQRYGSQSNIAVEFLRFSQPRDRLHDFHWVQVCIGPDATVIGTSSYITD